MSQKTDLSEEKSRQAVEIGLDYLKGKLPEPIAGQLDSILEGQAGAGGLDSLTKGLGGLFGG